MRSTALCFLLAIVMLGGCSKSPANSTAAPPKGGSAAQQQPEGSRPGVQSITGPVVETMDAASYTYVRVKTDKGDVWAATAQFKVAVGDQVTVPLEMQQTDFRSPTLNRQFPVIYFASHIDRVGRGEASPAMTPAHGSASPGGPSTAAPSTAPVTPAEGGMTVADVWAKRDALAGKTVIVRGRVVKFNGGILDRNWIHIQDGTGDGKDGSNDLTITSQDGAKVGDVITATGKVAVKKDFGAGYAYAVIVEGATLK